jgi:hypothetical protein
MITNPQFSFLSLRDHTLLGASPSSGPPAANDRLQTLPMVLAGPILRHTDANSVSVWLALRLPKESILPSQLLIYNHTANSSPSVGTTSDTQFVQLGENLTLILITAAGAFFPGNIYKYNILFNYKDANDFTLQANLTTPGFFSADGDISHLTYAGAINLPSFALVPNLLSDVHIVHTSCRKPHGPQDDAFPLISKNLIGPNINQPLARPHLLFLTGDQIYADDVTEQLLFLLDDASKALMGWVENLPTKTDANGTLVTVEEVDEGLPNLELNSSNTTGIADGLKPGHRQYAIYDKRKPAKQNPSFQSSGLTSEDGSSHLMRLGEFYSMYLFAWADTLWGSFSGPDELWELMYKEVIPARPASSRKKIKEYKAFEKAYEQLVAFKEDLQHVRRAMANVPTYMACDDHEVTDDWFLNLRWCQNVLGDDKRLVTNIQNGPTYQNPPITRQVIQPNYLGRRIITNGLAAFNVFQAWGNQHPDKYKGTGAYTSNPEYCELLTLIESLAFLPGAADPYRTIDFTNLSAAILPKIGIVIPGTNQEKEDAKALISPLRYEIALFYPGRFRVLVLDSRTKRGFGGNGGELNAQLISLHELDTVFNLLHDASTPAPTYPVTVILAPAPVFGHNFVEGLQDIITTRSGADKNGDGIPESAIGKDREAWAFNEELFTEFIKRVSTYTSVVILSGDVHYGYSLSAKIWNESLVSDQLMHTGEIRGMVAQLVSSASKNASPQTLTRRISPLPTIERGRAIWKYDSQYRDALIIPNQPNPSDPNVEVLPYEITSMGSPHRILLGKPPYLRYSYQLHKDVRRPDEQGYIPSASGGTVVDNQLQAASWHRQATRLGFGHKVYIAYNNIGSVRFSNNLFVEHRILHKKYGLPWIGDSDDIETTLHILPLLPPAASELRPGDPPVED